MLMKAKKRCNFTFDTVPVMKRRRNSFDLSNSHYTTMNVGELVPYYVQEVYPGDSFKIDSAFQLRSVQAFKLPSMQSAFLDQQFYFVPARELYEHWDEMFGENKNGAWANAKEYTVPLIDVSYGNAMRGSCGCLADHMGIPPYDERANPVGAKYALWRSVLPFRAVAKVWNEWFRDENLQPPVNIRTDINDDGTAPEVMCNATDGAWDVKAWSVNSYCGQCPPAGKLHDYFTSALPAPQKGEPVGIPWNLVNSEVPVYTRVASHDKSTAPLELLPYDGTAEVTSASKAYPLITNGSANGGYSSKHIYQGNTALDGTFGSSASSSGLAPVNLYTNFANAGTNVMFNIEEFRESAMLQALLERDARCGTRYVEYIRAAFGFAPSDYKLGRSEYLGGCRNPINIQQVASTNNSNDTELGQLGAFSLTFGQAHVRKSFEEHGFIIGFACIRTRPLYQQGIDKFWSRYRRCDFFDPIFAHVGEQPIYESELYVEYEPNEDNPAKTPHGGKVSSKVFGYQEAWADLRQRSNRVSGGMRTVFETGLDRYHFGEYFENAPTLNASFITQGTSGVNRSFNVEPTEREPAFAVEFFNKVDKIAVGLPLRSIPSFKM